MNAGNIRIHKEGKLGFHTNMINNSVFEQNHGLSGFYGNQALIVSGTYKAIFHDMELQLGKGLLLHNSIRVHNHLHFQEGIVQTTPNASFYFGRDSFYSGASNHGYLEGTVVLLGKQEFVIPIGQGGQLRPLQMKARQPVPQLKAAYYKGPPPGTTFERPGITAPLEAVSQREYWLIHGTKEVQLTFTWNAQSELMALGGGVGQLTVAGFGAKKETWEALPRGHIEGSLADGKISLNPLIPDRYFYFTFGRLQGNPNSHLATNYLISPNGDGINDKLVFHTRPKHIKIYDRNGLKVFEKVNYIDEFRGFANTRFLGQDLLLPEGVYYYLFWEEESPAIQQGFLYLIR